MNEPKVVTTELESMENKTQSCFLIRFDLLFDFDRDDADCEYFPFISSIMIQSFEPRFHFYLFFMYT